MGNRKDSRLRTVQREYGKVFVVVFGVRYKPPTGSKMKVGDDVMVVEGSRMDQVTFRRPKDEYVEHDWLSAGIVGGEQAKAKARADWEKFLAGEKSIGMVKEKSAKTAAEVPSDPQQEVKDLARDYDGHVQSEVIAVRFRDPDSASAFRLAVTRHKWKAGESLTDDNTSETVVLVRLK